MAARMCAAGLTHGGFYAHFDSREELIGEAVERALADTEQRVPETTAAPNTRWPRSPTPTCPPPTATTRRAAARWPRSGTDVPRVGGRAQEAYRRRSSATSATWERALGDGDEAGRRRAATTLSAMVGALMLARALGPGPRSDEILRDVREAVRERRLS